VILSSNRKFLQATALTPFFPLSDSLQVDGLPAAWPKSDFKHHHHQQQQQHNNNNNKTKTNRGSH
jgi:hypothetical protein